MKFPHNCLLLLVISLLPIVTNAQNTLNNVVIDNTPDSIQKAQTARPKAGGTRQGTRPVLYLVGNSTMRTGTLGNGDNGQWGWGRYLPEYIDTTRISIENQALGGMSSRTFYNQLWQPIHESLHSGDYVLIELGHNDNGEYDSGRARATLPGISQTDSLAVVIKETGQREVVRTYGEYLRKYVRETIDKGAHPVLMSLTPRNTLVQDNRRGELAREIASEFNIPYIDLNTITHNKYVQYGAWKTSTMFYLDNIHTSAFGARANAQSAAEGFLTTPLSIYVKQPIYPTYKRKDNKPHVFITGDSTVKNQDRDNTGQWGWGALAHLAVDTALYTSVNAAMAGRSLRSYIREQRWAQVYNSLQNGDVVLIQFGHNDIGEPTDPKARADINGIADSSHVYRIRESGEYEVVYTYGWYLRYMINDCREKGATPILVTITPRNIWREDKIERRTSPKDAWTWAMQVAEQTNTKIIDLHTLAADELDKIGQQAAQEYYNTDHTHLSLKGATLMATILGKAIEWR